MSSAIAEQIRSTVEARLRELAPALSEFEQLRGVLAILDDPDAARRLIEGDANTAVYGVPASLLDGDSAPVVSRLSPQRRHPSRLGHKPGADGRAPQGANKQRILAVIAEHPGIAAPQVAKLTGLKRPLVASTISRLKRTGELRSHGEGVCLAKLAAAPSSRLALLSHERLYAATGSG